MDFSGLPKMSKTPPAGQPADDPVTVAQQVMPVSRESAPPSSATTSDVYSNVEPPGFGSAWISAIAGVIFLAMGQTFARFLAAKLGGHDFPTGWLWEPGTPKAGLPKSYFELSGGTAWSDMSLFLMGAALVLDAAVLGLVALRRRAQPLIWLTLAVTLVASLVNAGVITYLFSLGITPLASLVALLVGGFILSDHALLLRRR